MAEAAEKTGSEIKVFGRWNSDGIEIHDVGLVGYINLKPIIVPRASGSHAAQQFYKSKLHIVNRLINKLYVSGHRGKKHRFSSGRNVGQFFTVSRMVESAFEMIEKKSKENPVEVLVRAVENAAPIEEIISFQKGGIFAREPVLTAPQRRVDIALKHIAQSTFKKSAGHKKPASECLAEEIFYAAKGDPQSMAISERVRKEKEAKGAR